MAAKCYDIDDNEDPDFTPCWESTNGKAVPCCYANSDMCASNGLCVTTNDASKRRTPYFIYGCTGLGWTNGSIPGCPTTICLSTGGTGVKPCGNSLYCCYGFTDCDCDNSTQVFSLDPVRIVTSLALATSATGIATINQASYTTATASSSLVLSSSVTQATATPSSSSGTTSNVAIGLGVGLGVGIPLSLFALGVLWLLKRWYGQTRTAGSGTAVGQSTGGRVGSQSYGYPGMAVKAELENQPKVELPGNRGVELQSGSIIPWELAGQSNR